MKKVILVGISSCLLAGAAFAETKNYPFKFVLGKESYTYSTTASSWDEAFKRASQNCFDHFKSDGKLTEQRGLDIIDACVNEKRL